MAKVIHYIGNEWRTKFIVAKTKCGKCWSKVDEFTEYKAEVTCKKCLKKLV